MIQYMVFNPDTEEHEGYIWFYDEAEAVEANSDLRRNGEPQRYLRVEDDDPFAIGGAKK